MTAFAATFDARAAADEQADWMQSLLLELMAAPTVLGHEEQGQLIVERVMGEVGLATSSVAMDEDGWRQHRLAAQCSGSLQGQRNVVGQWDPPRHSRGGRSLMVSSHIDVIEPQSAELFTRDPFEPHVTDDGRSIVGWGVLKAGLVTQLAAVRALRAAGLVPGAVLRLQSVVAEETSGNGLLATMLARPLLDGALIGGCLGDRVPVGQVGALWFTIRVAQPPGHAGDGPSSTAIDQALALLPAFREFAKRADDDRPASCAGLGPVVTLNVGVIKGGTVPSVAPGECEISCRIGLFPQETVAERRAQLQAVLDAEIVRDRRLQANPPQLRFEGFSAPGFELPDGSPIVEQLATAHRLVRGREPQRAVLTTALESRIPVHLGVPAVAAGPAVQRLHAIDEAVDVAELVSACAVTAQFIYDWCAMTPFRDV